MPSKNLLMCLLTYGARVTLKGCRKRQSVSEPNPYSLPFYGQYLVNSGSKTG